MSKDTAKVVFVVAKDADPEASKPWRIVVAYEDGDKQSAIIVNGGFDSKHEAERARNATRALLTDPEMMERVKQS